MQMYVRVNFRFACNFFDCRLGDSGAKTGAINWTNDIQLGAPSHCSDFPLSIRTAIRHEWARINFLRSIPRRINPRAELRRLSDSAAESWKGKMTIVLPAEADAHQHGWLTPSVVSRRPSPLHWSNFQWTLHCRDTNILCFWSYNACSWSSPFSLRTVRS